MRVFSTVGGLLGVVDTIVLSLGVCKASTDHGVRLANWSPASVETEF